MWKEKKEFLISFLLCVLFSGVSECLLSQGPPIQWQNTIGGNQSDICRIIIPTTDGGYMGGGYSLSGISGDKTNSNNGNYDYWIVKLDAIGNIIWQKSFGGSGKDPLTSLSQTTDGGYILGGYSDSGISGSKTEVCQGGYDYWVLKLDALGNVQWQNTIGSSGHDYLNNISQTADGGYILGGSTAGGSSGDKSEANLGGTYDYWVVKLDATGSIVWENTIGGNGWDALDKHNVMQTSDGGYILAGFSSSGISGDKTEANQGAYDYWVVKLNAVGGIVWQNTIGGSGNDVATSIVQTTDGGYFVGGYSSSNATGDKTEASLGGEDYWVLKLDVAGNIQWQNTIGGNSNERLSKAIQMSDGGFALGGYSNSGISGDKMNASQGGNDYWVLKLDGVGNIQWQKTLGGSLEDGLHSLFERTECTEGLILGGYSISNISGDKSEVSQGSNDYWIIKLEDCTILPVELVEFEAVCSEGIVKFNWSTISEVNSDYFVIERSDDLVNWTAITIVDGAGSSSSVLSYSAIDTINTFRTIMYYRLKQVDFNGQCKYFDYVWVNCTEELGDEISLYEGDDKQLNIGFSGILGWIEVVIVDNMGRKVYSDEFFVSEGQKIISIPTPYMNSGLYHLIIRNNNKFLTRKFVH